MKIGIEEIANSVEYSAKLHETHALFIEGEMVEKGKAKELITKAKIMADIWFTPAEKLKRMQENDN